MAHPNKHIREAIEHAEHDGWRFVKAGPRAHIYGTLFCPTGGRLHQFRALDAAKSGSTRETSGGP